VQEPAQHQLYGPVLDRLGVTEGTVLLDAGCGSGVAARMCADRGASVTGLDATEAFVEIARQRVPEGSFDVGDLEALPFPPDSFDVVTGFNSFQYAADPVEALREARRVARPGGAVAIMTWGPAEACEAAPVLAALASFLPPPPAGAPGPFALSEPGALAALVRRAGLEPVDEGDVHSVWTYPDLETALRGLLAGGPATRAIATATEAAVAEAVAAAIALHRNSDGTYELENVFRFLIARA